MQIDVPLNDGDDNTIHAIVSGHRDNPPLLLLHGYGGGGIFFYRIFKELSKEFKVYAIDMLGFGSSTRSDLPSDINLEDSLNFFMEMINNFRIAINCENMYIAGHSLGGYLAGLYSYYFPQFVRKAYLISPTGVGHNAKLIDMKK